MLSPERLQEIREYHSNRLAVSQGQDDRILMPELWEIIGELLGHADGMETSLEGHRAHVDDLTTILAQERQQAQTDLTLSALHLSEAAFYASKMNGYIAELEAKVKALTTPAEPPIPDAAFTPAPESEPEKS